MATLLEAKPIFTVCLISKIGDRASTVIGAKSGFEEKLKRRGIEVTNGVLTVNGSTNRVTSVSVTIRTYDSAATRAIVRDLAKQSGLGVTSIEAVVKS